MSTTKCLYLSDPWVLGAATRIQEMRTSSDGRTVMMLEETPFYAQGGGQPYDTGIIESGDARFEVQEVRKIDGEVLHFGRCVTGVMNVGDHVSCTVDAPRRIQNSLLHSAGHAIDAAIKKLRPEWIPSKGYHFPEGAYVEYKGTLAPDEKELLMATIADACRSFIAKKCSTAIAFLTQSEARALGYMVPDALPATEMVRVVTWESYGIPCGGTHVKNLGEIERVVIRKIKTEGDTVRISYTASYA